MNIAASSPLTWNDIARHLSAQPAGTRIHLPTSQVEHPRAAGMSPGAGVPLGQRTDYRADISHGRRLEIADFGSHYECHLERSLTPAEFDHAVRAEPSSTVAGATALGALLGVALGRDRRAALTGAVIGGIAALASAHLAAAPAPHTRDTSDNG